MYYYIIISIILLLLVFHGYNKIRYKYWMTQPIFYRYNVLNWCKINSIISTDRPLDTIHLNFLTNNVTYITDTGVPYKIDNIYINETERVTTYYDNIVGLMNDYPYFNKKLNNGNMKNALIQRKITKDKLKILLRNHDYNPIVTMNSKLIYKTAVDSGNILSINTVFGSIIGIPMYFYNKNLNGKGVRGRLPLYYSELYYNPNEIKEKDVTDMVATYHYKMLVDWDEVIMRCTDGVVHETVGVGERGSALSRDEKQMKREMRENMRNSDNKKKNQNLYEENGLKDFKKKDKIYTSIFKYTGATIPKVVVPFVVYHSFYIPIVNPAWYKVEYRFHPSIVLVKIGSQNMNILIDYLKKLYTNEVKSDIINPFLFSIVPALTHIMHMITSEIYSVYVLLQKNNAGIVQGTNDVILAVYMFKSSDKVVSNVSSTSDINNSNNNIIYLPTSIQMNATDNNSFIYGFVNALKMENRNKSGGCVAVDTLSHNKKIIDFLLLNSKPILVEKHTLMMYNYICKTVLPEQVLVMC